MPLCVGLMAECKLFARGSMLRFLACGRENGASDCFSFIFGHARGMRHSAAPGGNDMTVGENGKYVDLDGNAYREKPEHMTHLRGNVLVPKTHPRIVLRGKLDSLAACVMQAQIATIDAGEPGVAKDLQEIMDCISMILMGEATELPIKAVAILGMDEDRLRKVSHNPKQHLGVDHMIPNYRMGKPFVAVNAVRTLSREAELAADRAFVDEKGEASRPDLLQALNRLSSAVYVIMCRILGGHYKRGGQS